MTEIFKKHWALMTASVVEACLLTLQFLLPIFGIALMPVIVVLAVFIGGKTRRYIPLIFMAVYALLNIFFNYDQILVLILPAMFVLYAACLFLLKSKSIFLAFPIAAGAMLVAIVTPFALGSRGGETPDRLIQKYIEGGNNNIALIWLSKDYYEKTSFDAPYEKLAPEDSAYMVETLKKYGEYVREECKDYAMYYLALYAGLTAGGTLLLAIFMGRRRSPPDTLAKGFDFKATRLGWSYLKVVFIPVFLLGIAVLFMPLFRPLYAALFCFCVTVPCAFNGFTLLLHCAYYFKNKARIAAIIAVMTLSAACLIFEIGLFLLSLIGFADIIINVRKLLDYALS